MNPDSYFTSDLHLGHANVLKHDGRPFPNIEAHDEAVIGSCCDLPRHSHLWILGDVAFNQPVFERLLNKLSAAGISAHLIRGNHDDKIAWKQRCRFASANETAYLRHQLRDGSMAKFFLSHYAHRTWRSSDRGAYHLYGHSHGNLPGLGRSMDVGINCNEYKPVHLSAVLGRLSSLPSTPHHAQ